MLYDVLKTTEPSPRVRIYVYTLRLRRWVHPHVRFSTPWRVKARCSDCKDCSLAAMEPGQWPVVGKPLAVAWLFYLIRESAPLGGDSCNSGRNMGFANRPFFCPGRQIPRGLTGLQGGVTSRACPAHRFRQRFALRMAPGVAPRVATQRRNTSFANRPFLLNPPTFVPQCGPQPPVLDEAIHATKASHSARR